MNIYYGNSEFMILEAVSGTLQKYVVNAKNKN